MSAPSERHLMPILALKIAVRIAGFIFFFLGTSRVTGQWKTRSGGLFDPLLYPNTKSSVCHASPLPTINFGASSDSSQRGQSKLESFRVISPFYLPTPALGHTRLHLIWQSRYCIINFDHHPATNILSTNFPLRGPTLFFLPA